MDATHTPTAHSGHGWLTGVLPAAARRIRVDDPALAETLRHAGADLVDSRAEVEVVQSGRIRGDAELAVVLVDEDREWPTAPIRLVRGAMRVRHALRVRARARAARAELRRAGYPFVTIMLGNVEGSLPLLPGRAEPPSKWPLLAVIVGRKSGEAEPSILEVVMEASNLGSVRQPLVREGIIVLIGDSGVLRVSLGPGGRQSDEQRVALALLASEKVSPVVADRIPWPVSRGTVGLGGWTLERRLPGSPPAALADAIWSECLDFLVALHGVRRGGAALGIAQRAGVVARAVGSEAARTSLRDLGRRLEASLQDVPRGFAHGDFCRGNLLVDGEHLSGVVDWDYADAGQLPLLDLFHLWVNERRVSSRLAVGRSVREQLLPALSAGGDPVFQEYCARIGLDPEPELLLDLGLAYWVVWIARELELYSNRAVRPLWMKENVHVMIDDGARLLR